MNARRYYEEYWSNDKIEAARADPAIAKTLIEGTFRINQRNYEEAYITNPDGVNDILVYGSKDRNRAFHGDIVLVKIKPKQQWLVRETAYATYKKLHTTGKNTQKNDAKPVDSFENSDQSFDEAYANTCADISDGNINRYTSDELASVWYQMKRNNTTKPNAQVDGIIQSLHIVRPSSTDVMPTLYATRRCHSPFERPSLEGLKIDTDPLPAQPVKGKDAKDIPMVRDFPNEKIPNEFVQPVAQVVRIVQMKNSRAAVGKIRATTNGKRDFAFFVPSDSRVPRMLIPAQFIDPKFFDRPQDYMKFLFIARMISWQPDQHRPTAELYRALGNAGEIGAETEGLLLQYDIDTREFSQAVINCLPHVDSDHPWTIPETEFRHRRDLRKETVMTIDPATARDLDDALHIKEISNDLFEVGVHIADVSFFIREGSELDQWAKRRATSTYLVHKVVPMLPRLLCEDLCSLNAGVDRLTFSCIWHIRASTGAIESEWMGRSIINSCCKLTYEHAQGFIDEPGRHWQLEELPQIFNERQPIELSKNVNLLWRIAKTLKENRRIDGSLRIDMPKLQFTLDMETGFPTGVSRYDAKQSNNLVEEMMLLANRRVAETIAKHYPQVALLRRHPPPDAKQMREVFQLCENLGFPLEGTSSAQLERTLNRYRMGPEKRESILSVLQQLLMKPMQLALYFCTGSVESEYSYRHYALAMDYYTHFTSPIRRYPDVIVHRLLAAHCGYSPLPATLTKATCELIAENCNDRKLAAKNVSEASSEMFFALFVQKCGPIEEHAIVMNVLDHSFDVLLVRFGTMKRVYCDKLSICGWEFNETLSSTLELFWPKEGSKSTSDRFKQTIQLTTPVDVILTGMADEPLQYKVTLKSPVGAVAAQKPHCDQ